MHATVESFLCHIRICLPKHKRGCGLGIMLRRNSTSFPVEVAGRLRALADEWKTSGDAQFLKYYQYLVRAVIRRDIAISDARGLLVYHTMGMGKTRLAAAAAMAIWDEYMPVVLLAKGLQSNFERAVQAVAQHMGIDPAGAVKRFTFVSQDAYNSAAMMDSRVGNLERRVLIVDEAQNFFRAIISGNPESNAMKIYNMVMKTKNIRILFITGTPASKDPFELVPAFNMLAGYELLPTQYDKFYALYVKQDKTGINNKNLFLNRVLGLVSHVTHTKPIQPNMQAVPSTPADTATAAGSVATSAETEVVPPRALGGFPEIYPTQVTTCPMGERQYELYLAARENEMNEGASRPGQKPFNPNRLRPAPPALTVPGSKAGSTYYVRSRNLSISAIPPGTSVENLQDDMAPKLALIARRTAAAAGPVLIYSQFVEGALKPLTLYLQREGFVEWRPPATGGGRLTAELPAGLPIMPDAAPRDFPYRAKYMPPFAKMYDALCALPPIAGGTDGRLLDVVRTYPHDYETVDSLSDWFSEGARILCREKAYGSPADQWLKLKAYSKFGDARTAREAVYKAARGCNTFNAALALAIYRHAGAKRVLDPSAGWGDRYIAAAAAGVQQYVAWDPNPNLQNIYHEMSKVLPCPLDYHAEPFEDAAIQPGSFDTCIWSPPFFDKELYTGPKTSTTRHAGQQWWKAFYDTSLRKIAASLAPGGKFYLYASEGRMFQQAIDCMEACGLEYDGIIGFVTRTAQPSGATRTAQPSGVSPKNIVRPTYVWHKPGVAGGAAAIKRYATICGNVPAATRDMIVKQQSSPENANGELVWAVLISEAGAEGLDLKSCREVHLIEPYWDKSRDMQVIARSGRMGSHDYLPEGSRDLQPYLYVATKNEKSWNALPPASREAETIDEQFLKRAQNRYELCQSFRDALQEACLECTVIGYKNCHTCSPNGRPLMVGDAEYDASLPDPCEPLTAVEITSYPITDPTTGVQYEYTKDDELAFYRYDPKLDGHIRITEPQTVKRLTALLTAPTIGGGQRANRAPTTVVRLFSELKHKMDYSENYPIGDNQHLGQRKLLLSEIDFFNRHASGGASITAVYAGAAPGTHIILLKKMYPNTTFHLYDRAPFDPILRKFDGIHLHSELMTDDVAQKMAGSDLFISDIRTTTQSPSIISDMRMQESWVKTMKPKMAQLKFRLPFDWEGDFTYLGGELRIQAWPRPRSTEMRLECTADSPEMSYAIRNIEQKMCYYNARIRGHRNGSGKSNDQALEDVILKEYVGPMKEPREGWSRHITNLLGRGPKRAPHLGGSSGNQKHALIRTENIDPTIVIRALQSATTPNSEWVVSANPEAPEFVFVEGRPAHDPGNSVNAPHTNAAGWAEPRSNMYQVLMEPEVAPNIVVCQNAVIPSVDPEFGSEWYWLPDANAVTDRMQLEPGKQTSVSGIIIPLITDLKYFDVLYEGKLGVHNLGAHELGATEHAQCAAALGKLPKRGATYAILTITLGQYNGRSVVVDIDTYDYARRPAETTEQVITAAVHILYNNHL